MLSGRVLHLSSQAVKRPPLRLQLTSTHLHYEATGAWWARSGGVVCVVVCVCCYIRAFIAFPHAPKQLLLLLLFFFFCICFDSVAHSAFAAVRVLRFCEGAELPSPTIKSLFQTGFGMLVGGYQRRTFFIENTICALFHWFHEVAPQENRRFLVVASQGNARHKKPAPAPGACVASPSFF